MTNISGEPNPLFKLEERYKKHSDVHDVFGLILYTQSDPYVIKVLRDQDFWNALDAKSGPRWPIFSVRPKQGQLSVKPLFLVDIGLSGSDSEWNEPWENDELIERLEIYTTAELPMLMVFARGPEGEVFRSAISLAANSVDETYKILSQAIEVAAGAIKHVTPENIKHTFEVFNLIDSAIGQKILFQHIKQGVAFVQWVKSLFSLFGVG